MMIMMMNSSLSPRYRDEDRRLDVYPIWLYIRTALSSRCSATMLLQKSTESWTDIRPQKYAQAIPAAL